MTTLLLGMISMCNREEKLHIYASINSFLFTYMYACMQGKATEALRDREVKMAKEQDSFTVSPHWITAVSHLVAT